MNRMSRQTLLLFLLYLIVAIGLTLLGIRNQSRMDKPTQDEKEANGNKSGKLKPYELFYLDRNYPETNVNTDLYREKLKQSIAYDRSAPRSKRGLDHPWTVEGPGNIGGRVNTIAVHPVDPNLILLGYSNGGIYRTDDGGMTWNPVFDDQPSLSVGHITFDPHDPDRVWATTGDVNISGYYFLGSGVYRSEDRGQTWSYAGLEDTGILSKVAVDLFNPDIIYVGSLGYPSHPGNKRGLFRSIDGGASWHKTLTIDDSTGIIDIVTDPSKAGRVFASAWTRLRSSTKSTLVGPGTGLYKSEDYGATWTNVNGLPDGEHSRTGIEITNDGTLFISYIGEISDGECSGKKESLRNVYKSINSGTTWSSIYLIPVNGIPCDLVGGMGWYFEVLKVNPANPLDMFLLGVDLYRTLDGGQNWFEAAPIWWTYDVHADKHDLIFKHGNIYLATDGGAYKTDINQFGDWTDIENIPSTQFYRTAWNPHTPDQYYGGAQDNGTTGGNKDFINGWHRILGGDGFQPLFDPTEPSWMYALTQNGFISFSDNGGNEFEGLNKGLKGSRYWDMPFVMSSQDPKILFCGSDRMFRMDMKQDSMKWHEISPDLTRGDSILGGRYPAITAIAQSDLDDQRLYAGTQDGLIWTTSDGGANWTNITEGTPGFYVTSITCSTVDSQVVFATYSGYRDNDHQPYIYRSGDAGDSWEPIENDHPMLGVNSFYILPGWDDMVLFSGTDGGVYVSVDGGIKWERMGTNMPYMPVYDLDYNPVENKIVAATFSRGLMTFPVEELDLVSKVKEVEYLADNITVSPNIVNDWFAIQFEVNKFTTFSPKTILITGYDGNIIHKENVSDWNGKSMEINLNGNYANGLYIVSISDGLKMYSKKILISL